MRGSLALAKTGRAWALLHGRDHVLPEDIEQLFVPVLGHRLVLRSAYLAETRHLSAAAALEQLRDRCLELVPPPRPDWAVQAPPRSGGTAGSGRVAERSRTVFPLVPKHRLAGLPFGAARSIRRGRGSDLAGSRPYVPGDPISTIDWRASARLSTARADDEFVVRERFAEEAPQVVVLGTGGRRWRSTPARRGSRSRRRRSPPPRRSSRAGSPPTAPPATSTTPGGDDRGGEPFWLAPRSRSPWPAIADHDDGAAYDAPDDSLARGLEFLVRLRGTLAPGRSCSSSPTSSSRRPVGRLAIAHGRHWELVPVVIQDPTWDQSFPAAGPLVLPLADPRSGALLEARLTRREARAWRGRRERARAELLSGFAALGVDPVLLDSSDPDAVLRTFLDWADRRRPAAVGRGDGLVVAAVVAAVVLTVVLGRDSTPPPAGAAPLSVSTSLEPGSTRFGDPVVAEVDVAYDPQTVDAAGIRVHPGFTPTSQRPRRASRTATGARRCELPLHAALRHRGLPADGDAAPGHGQAGARDGVGGRAVRHGVGELARAA